MNGWIERPRFTPSEIAAVRREGGADGLPGLIPARCYYDEGIYRFEVDRILKRNWLAVGRWDWAEKPGNYFTLKMFGEPLIIIRDRTTSCIAWRTRVATAGRRWSRRAPATRAC